MMHVQFCRHRILPSFYPAYPRSITFVPMTSKPSLRIQAFALPSLPFSVLIEVSSLHQPVSHWAGGLQKIGLLQGKMFALRLFGHMIRHAATVRWLGARLFLGQRL